MIEKSTHCLRHDYSFFTYYTNTYSYIYPQKNNKNHTDDVFFTNISSLND